MNKQLLEISQKEMTRKEFLATVGVGLLGIMGFGSIIKLLTGKSHLGSHQSSSMGYGASSYGGK